MKFTNRKANQMAKAIRAIVINAVIFGIGLIAGMSLKAGYMAVTFALTTEGNYYKAVFTGFFGVGCVILTASCLNLVRLIITNNNK